MAVPLEVSIGQLCWIKLAYTDANGAAADPATITLHVKDPTGAVTAYAITDLTHDSTGNYHLALVPTITGFWSWHDQSTGAVQAAEDKPSALYVQPAVA